MVSSCAGTVEVLCQDVQGAIFTFWYLCLFAICKITKKATSNISYYELRYRKVAVPKHRLAVLVISWWEGLRKSV